MVELRPYLDVGRNVRRSARNADVGNVLSMTVVRRNLLPVAPRDGDGDGDGIDDPPRGAIVPSSSPVVL